VAGAATEDVAEKTESILKKVDEMVIQVRLTALEQLN
jgi:hypothetical protein